VNNDSTLNVPVESGRSSIGVPGNWRNGWNVLELGAGGDVTFVAIENDD
jgi:hypothetical protein